MSSFLLDLMFIFSHPSVFSLVLLKKSHILLEDNVSFLRCFLLAGALPWLCFMAQPLEHLNGFELCPFFLLLLLFTLWILMEVLMKMKIKK